MTTRLRCLLGLHQWRTQRNEAGETYRQCAACRKQDDPGSRITTGHG